MTGMEGGAATHEHQPVISKYRRHTESRRPKACAAGRQIARDEVKFQFVTPDSKVHAISQNAIHVSMGLIASGVFALLILRGREKALTA
jgi:hypothetical protein